MASTRLYEAEQSLSQIAANSAAIASGDLVALSGWFVIKAINTTVRPLTGVANGSITVAANNQTVDKLKVSYTRLEPHDTRFEYVPSADIVQADVGKFYGLTAAGLVDVATASATIAAGSVVRLEAVLAARKGVFIVVS